MARRKPQDPNKKPKKKPKWNENAAIRSAVRRIFSRSPVVREILNKSRRERTWYKKNGTEASKPRVEFQCSSCGEWFMGKDIQVDHVDPVVDPTVGFLDWNTFIERLFCNASNLKILCKAEHKAKSDLEKSIGAKRRQADKLKNV
jgi:5-methylcytosine-specific restriction endonuclease McrA